ncbi:MAG: ABC transporter ATP-binding protein/permease [Clostridia bacterium]|nr:ABC transporter ATP-binding protein/permease [Clostridia bacterium]
MLKLDKIKKIYKTADQHVEALKGISIEFRQSEFVSILGPSGCGKTTLLNIVGGLDRYNSGDLVINGKSTKLYTDKDWDSYRNHSVGFVFQSYNLIPHQTVLENVELALTLSGIGKEERKKRAAAVLKKVGLGDKLKYRPNQLSGGQMQRVAIARALVNDPEIILADEPTGALDTVTSVQIMELLKEISKDKLIVMVTHNPELAEKYSTRIVKLLDGKIIDDSNPYKSAIEVVKPTEQPVTTARKKKKSTPKTKMSIFTALMLSLRNLMTKKARTFLVSFAGAIGIIGIALVLAISNGFNNYVNNMQEQSLANYPVTIQTKSIDLQSALTAMFMPSNNEEKTVHDEDKIYPKEQLLGLLDSVASSSTLNDLAPFYRYLNLNKDKLKDVLTAIGCSYDLGLEFYRSDIEEASQAGVYPRSSALFKMAIMYSLNYFSYVARVNIAPSGSEEYIVTPIEGETLYPIVEGYVSKEASEKLQEEGRYSLNLMQIMTIISKLTQGSINLNSYRTTSTGAVSEMIDNETLIEQNYDLIAGEKVKDAKDVYLVLDKNSELDDSILYALGLISDDEMNAYINNMLRGKKQTFSIKYEDVLGKEFKVLNISDYVVKDTIASTETETVYKNYYEATAAEQAKKDEVLDDALYMCENVVKVVGILRLKEDAGTNVLSVGLNYSPAFAKSMIDYHNAKATTVNNKDVIKPIDLSLPTAISLYAVSFEGKNKIKAFIEEYNNTVSKENKISYSDLAGTLMSSLSTIITSISYVLIAFVSVSLIVSSIMIGIITYISVIERTKEIGVLRSVGASKRDIKHVFTAESGMIGLFSGLLGILVAFLLLIPINIILATLAGISGLAQLPFVPCLLLILISVVLTLIAGVVPARVAAKRDPVVALRSE